VQFHQQVNVELISILVFRKIRLPEFFTGNVTAQVFNNIDGSFDIGFGFS